MPTTYKVLTTDADFLAASLTQSRVSVWLRIDPDPIGHLIDYGGSVEEFTPETVVISGERFFRWRFEFRAYTK